MAEKLRIVVCGYIGLFPAGGAVWDYIQYVMGFAGMGHDVYYIEDTGTWPSFVPEGEPGDGRFNIAYLTKAMEDLGLGDRWAYRDPATLGWFGLPEAQVVRIMRSADIFISISCSAALREEWIDIPVRIVIDSDPMFTQMQLTGDDGFTKGARGLKAKLAAYTHHFTFGENIGADDCLVPQCGIDWIPTRQPIALDRWDSDPPGAGLPFSTVMNWSALPPLEFHGETYGQKDSEFGLVIDVPAHCPNRSFDLAVNGQDKPGFPTERIAAAGWRLLDPAKTVPDAQSYHDFILQSAGEISVAKHAYVASRSGWFSCRTACYLAASRPAVVQDTGWSRYVPPGDGLYAFSTREEAIEHTRRIGSDLPRHARAARALAHEHFDASLVLSQMIERARVHA
ncbi:hypothetical protein [Croceicoccus mobilis]|uniref:Glycosyltransferase family 1 protein n=1 Tax=Croceicoccus mobilis TaxID=1703339 RepID=A0A916YX45_9SPHN|nr:hypothetical protein [Croceicoccus mobilis]GGD65766.1 hypothetical protein GCM10010990_14050 [Croceicoccus mobilis]